MPLPEFIKQMLSDFWNKYIESYSYSFFKTIFEKYEICVAFKVYIETFFSFLGASEEVLTNLHTFSNCFIFIPFLIVYYTIFFYLNDFFFKIYDFLCIFQKRYIFRDNCFTDNFHIIGFNYLKKYQKLKKKKLNREANKLMIKYQKLKKKNLLKYLPLIYINDRLLGWKYVNLKRKIVFDSSIKHKKFKYKVHKLNFEKYKRQYNVQDKDVLNLKKYQD